MLHICNGCTHMLQTSIFNVSSVFSDVCWKCVFVWMLHTFHTYIANILFGYAYVLQWFSLVSTKHGRQSTEGYAQGSDLSVDRCASYELDGDVRHNKVFIQVRPP
jgi:hypothetical protein